MVAVDTTTEDSTDGIGETALKGVLFGYDPTQGGAFIQVDQGLDTTDISTTQNLSADLVETQYLIEMDNRLGSLVSEGASVSATVSFIDDDNIAFYYITSADGDFFSDITDQTGTAASSVRGPRGSRLTLQVQASLDLQTSTSLFTRLGDTTANVAAKTGKSSGGFHVINATIRVSGVTTGFRLDIPIKYVKSV